MFDSPFRDTAVVRCNCDIIVDRMGAGADFIRADLVNKAVDIDITIIRLIRRNRVVDGTKDLNEAGSNVEKMSGIMQDLDCSFGDFEGH